MKNTALSLSNNDPKIINAPIVEKALVNHYGIEAKEHFITLPEQQIRVRILEGLDLRIADVVAHSMGAHWSTLLAMEHPDKLEN